MPPGRPGAGAGRGWMKQTATEADEGGHVTPQTWYLSKEPGATPDVDVS